MELQKALETTVSEVSEPGKRQQLSVLVDVGIIDELRDAAVALMGEGITLTGLAEEALAQGLLELRARYFNGQRPPPRRIQPRRGRRPQ
jgi:hypothetical protein